MPCALHLANSSTVRYAQLFTIPPQVKIECNRGVNGIEGSLSTAIGYATASNELNFIVIGDLSFFYDMNAIWNRNYGTNIRILLLNNGGGEIFHTLPGMDKSGRSRKFITAEHDTTAHGWAEECGFIYIKVSQESELKEAMSRFTTPETQMQPMLLEVFTDKEQDTMQLKEYHRRIKNKE